MLSGMRYDRLPACASSRWAGTGLTFGSAQGSPAQVSRVQKQAGEVAALVTGELGRSPEPFQTAVTRVEVADVGKKTT